MYFLKPIPSTAAIIGGAVVCVIGGIILNNMPEIIQDSLARNMALNPKTDIYNLWSTMPLPNYRQFYFFNYTNIDEFLANWRNGTKPRVEEMGPYTYKVNEKKTDVVFLEGDLLQYRSEFSFVFQPNMSNGSPDDLIFTVNAPIVGMVGVVQEIQLEELNALFFTTDEQLFVTETVDNLLFEGYLVEAVEKASMALDQTFLPDNKFAYFYKANNTKADVHIIYRGNDDIQKLGLVVQWNYTEKLPFWTGDCNNVTGYVGPFPPQLGKVTIPLFSPDMCRKVSMSYQREAEYLEVKLNRYVMTPQLYGDYNLQPENACYCSKEEGTCQVSGLSRLAPCKMDVPVFISMPHFLFGDFRLLDAIDGLSPDPEKHQSFLELEQVTSGPFRVAKRVQTNILLQHRPFVTLVEDVPDIILPMFWMNEHMEITEELADMLKEKLSMIYLAHCLPYVILIVGGFIGNMGVICAIVVMFKKKQNEEKL